jgi:pro-apoptotic serine protease NMA111
MLVAETVLPGGPSHELIEEGDILIEVDGELLTKFVRLDEILDSSVGRTVNLLVQRGGENIEVELEVDDLHAITPDRFVTVCGAAFHDLSYQQARLYAIPVSGVYVCEPSGSFRFDGTDRGWMIESVDQKETPDLETFIEVMKGVPGRLGVLF